MKRSTRPVLLLTFLIAALCLATPTDAQVYSGTFPIDESQQVPPTGSPAIGTGIASLDTATNKLTWNISWSGVVTFVNTLHFHGPAPPGQNAGIQIGIGNANPNIGSAILSPSQATNVINGLWYVNVHSAAHGLGEIRGQVLLTLEPSPAQPSRPKQHATGPTPGGTTNPAAPTLGPGTPTKILSAEIEQISVRHGCAQHLSIDAGEALAGHAYLLLGSLSGATPGVALPAVTVPLNMDDYLRFTLRSPNTAPLHDSFGTLDDTGTAHAVFTLPPGSDPALVGLTAFHAVLVFDGPVDPAHVVHVSDPIPLTFVP